MPLINCKIELDLRWTKKCAISEISRTFRAVGDPPEQKLATTTISSIFQINNVKLYVPVVTLLINDNINFLESIKQGFKRTTSSNKIDLKKNNNSDYLIDPRLRNVFMKTLLSFKTGYDDPTIYSFDKYYMPLAEIKDFNALWLTINHFLISQ